MYTDYKLYRKYKEELEELLSERSKLLSLTDEQALEINGEEKAISLYYLSADIEMYQELVDDYVDADEAEEAAIELRSEMASLCYSQGLSF